MLKSTSGGGKKIDKIELYLPVNKSYILLAPGHLIDVCCLRPALHNFMKLLLKIASHIRGESVKPLIYFLAEEVFQKKNFIFENSSGL